MIEPGDPAPDFTLRDQDGKHVSLADLRGQTIAARLLPARLQPGLHRPAASTRRSWPSSSERGVELLGIGVDPPFATRRSRSSSGSIPLLADFHPKGEVAKAYGLYVDECGMAGRALVLIGADGTSSGPTSRRRLGESPATHLILDAASSFAPEATARQAARPAARC